MGHIFVEFHRDLGPPMDPARRPCSHKRWRRHGRCGPSRPGRCQGGEGSQTLRFFQGGARCSNGEDEMEIWEGMGGFGWNADGAVNSDCLKEGCTC